MSSKAKVNKSKATKPIMPNQEELNGMPPDTELGRLTKLYSEQRKKVNDAKSEQFETERLIANELKKEKRRNVKSAGFQFEIRTGQDELVIKKI